jgi:hypothetical protein
MRIANKSVTPKSEIQIITDTFACRSHEAQMLESGMNLRDALLEFTKLKNDLIARGQTSNAM